MFLEGGQKKHHESAYALDEAVRFLRESGASCVRWVPFMHLGAQRSPYQGASLSCLHVVQMPDAVPLAFQSQSDDNRP